MLCTAAVMFVVGESLFFTAALKKKIAVIPPF